MWNNNINSIIYTKFKVYTKNILNARYSTTYDNVNFTRQLRSQTTATFPTILFQKLAGSEIGSDLSGQNINGIISNIQIDVTTNTSQTDVERIADACMEAMKKMRYKAVSDLIVDSSESDVYRIIARYSRVIGCNDTID